MDYYFIDCSEIKFYNAQYRINCRIVDKNGETLYLPHLFTEAEQKEYSLSDKRNCDWDFSSITLEELKKKVQDIVSICVLCNRTRNTKYFDMIETEEYLRRFLGEMLYVDNSEENEEDKD